MVIITFIFAALYLLLGISFYAIINFSSITALIPPLVIAIIFLIGALLSLKPQLRMHVMHILALLSIILFFAFLNKYPPTIDYLTAAEGYQTIDKPLANVEKTFISLLSLAFFITTFISFFKARVLRKNNS
ncbi:hypothetical protein JD969_05415 [Planctomycetota bacterium]|nr:hypothetical protein JD969_05415 [Planctomycetota bacterium]